jgi:hypothetical protein
LTVAGPNDGRLLGSYVAAEAEPEILPICRNCRASYERAVDLSETLSAPSAEQFNTIDWLHRLEVGSGAMPSTSFKHVIVALLRRSLRSCISWLERSSMVREPQISRVCAEMAATRCGAHDTESRSHDTDMSVAAVSLQGKPTPGAPPTISGDPASSEAELRPGAPWLLIQSNLKGSIDYLADPRPAPV